MRMRVRMCVPYAEQSAKRLIEEVVNSSPYGDAWLMKVRLSDPSQVAGLLSAADYEKLVAESGGH